jgi:hypothetical protein
MINMYIAIILENYDKVYEQEEIGITEDDFEDFYLKWQKYDPYATQFIKLLDLPKFVSELGSPLGILKSNEMAITALNLPIIKGDLIHCLDVLNGLTSYTLGNVNYTEELKAVQIKIDKLFSTHFPLRVRNLPITTTLERKKFEVAARTIQRAWRQYNLKTCLINKIIKKKANSKFNNKSYEYISVV